MKSRKGYPIICRGVEFWEDDFIEYKENCPICGYGIRFPVARLKNQFRYLKCNDCLAVSASHYAKEDVLNRYYSNYYKDSIIKDERGEEGVTHDNSALFATHICSNFKFSNTKTNIEILDYAGGSGAISLQVALNLLSRYDVKTVKILIVDYDESNIINYDKDSRISFNKIAPDEFWKENDEKFDIVLASAILEHIFLAGDVLVKFWSKLQMGGYIYIRAPYMIPLYRFLSKFGIRIGMLFPEHVHDFSREFFEKAPSVLKLYDLEVVSSQPSLFQDSFKERFFTALASRIIRFPYHINKKYPFIGGWEVIWCKNCVK